MKKINTLVKDDANKTPEEKEQALRRQYLEAENDPDRQEVITDWKVLEGQDWE